MAKDKDKEFVIIGLGRFGSNLAHTLHGMGFEVLGVDSDDDKVHKNVDSCTHVVQADATDETNLRSLGVGNFEVAVVSIGHDLEASVLVTLLVKELGVPQVIAKASTEVHGKLLQRVGADRVVFPERDMGVRLANHLAMDNIIDYLEVTPEISMAELNTTSRMHGKTFRDLDLRARHGINVVAIRRGGVDVIVSPGADDPIREGDILLALASNEALREWHRSM